MQTVWALIIIASFYTRNGGQIAPIYFSDQESCEKAGKELIAKIPSNQWFTDPSYSCFANAIPVREVR